MKAELKLVERDEDTGICINGVLYRSVWDIPQDVWESMMNPPRMRHGIITNIDGSSSESPQK